MSGGMFNLVGRPQQGYNPAVHGAYHPGRFYGRADKPLGEVKVAELGAWLGRRSKNPVDWARCANRAWWRWACNWLLVKKPTSAPVAQFLVTASTAYYFLQYRAHSNERHAKYH